MWTTVSILIPGTTCIRK